MTLSDDYVAALARENGGRKAVKPSRHIAVRHDGPPPATWTMDDANTLKDLRRGYARRDDERGGAR